MWYVIQVLTGEENNTILEFNHFIPKNLYRNIFCPLYESLRKTQKGWIKVKKKLFPGYLFIDMDEENVTGMCDALKTLVKKTRFLKNTDTILPIYEDEQNYLMAIMNEDYCVSVSKGYIIGDKVCIISGGLKNFNGKIKKIDRHKRSAELDVFLYGHITRISVSLEIIQKITEDNFIQNKNEITENDNNDSLDNRPKVNIINGIFTGITGRLISTNETTKESTVS
nr:antiterminator LoaP [Lachnospiraceae bacterium]